MRRFGFLTAAPLAIALVACGSDNQGGDDDVPVDAADPLPGSNFRITTPDITIHPGEEVTYCYYTTVPTTETLGVKRWSSTMTPTCGACSVMCCRAAGTNAWGWAAETRRFSS